MSAGFHGAMQWKLTKFNQSATTIKGGEEKYLVLFCLI